MAEKGRLPTDGRSRDMQVFTPREGITLTSPYTPTENTVCVLGDDVTITIDTKAVDYSAGNVICFAEGVTYTLSTSIDVHTM